MVEADGYKNVKSLVQAPDGAWRGLAMRGAVEMAISVDANGRVLAEQPGVTADGGGGVEARE